MRGAIEKDVDQIHACPTMAALENTYYTLAEKHQGDPPMLWAIQEATVARKEVLERREELAGARLADDSFCQCCGARGVVGRLCPACERS